MSVPAASQAAAVRFGGPDRVAAGRGSVAAGTCPTPHAISGLLPAMFHDDDLVLRLVAGLDDVLAPALVAMDCLWTYIDPRLAPTDFLDWLTGWVGLAADLGWSEDRTRALVMQAVELYRWQGTARGLAAHLALCTGSEPEIVDPGGVSVSESPLGTMPGDGGDEVIVRVRATGDGGVDLAELEAIVEAAKPAHLRHRVEIL